MTSAPDQNDHLILANNPDLDRDALEKQVWALANDIRAMAAPDLKPILAQDLTGDRLADVIRLLDDVEARARARTTLPVSLDRLVIFRIPIVKSICLKAYNFLTRPRRDQTLRLATALRLLAEILPPREPDQ